jgi:hypothetical protein
MRTTLTLDDELVRAARRIAGKRGTSLKAVVNEALRIGIRGIANPPPRVPYRTKTRSLTFLPGIDAYKLGQIGRRA